MDATGLVLLPGAGLGPRRYVILTADRELPPSLQDRYARRLGGSQVELDSGRLPMVGHPDELAKILTSFLTELPET